jgi:hypothetical protein
MTNDLAKQLLKNIEYYMDNQDPEGLAGDLALLINEVAVNNDCESVLAPLADVLNDNYVELCDMDAED